MKIPVQMKHQKSAQCDSQKKKKSPKSYFQNVLANSIAARNKAGRNKSKRALGVRSFQVTGNIPEAKPKKTNEKLEEK